MRLAKGQEDKESVVNRKKTTDQGTQTKRLWDIGGNPRLVWLQDRVKGKQRRSMAGEITSIIIITSRIH